MFYQSVDSRMYAFGRPFTGSYDRSTMTSLARVIRRYAPLRPEITRSRYRRSARISSRQIGLSPVAVSSEMEFAKSDRA